MNPWLILVDLVRALLFAVAHVTGGGLGAAILIVSALARVALLPVTLRMARRAREHRDALSRLEPRLARIRARHAGDDARIAEQTLALYREHGVGLMPRGTVSAMLVQAPVFGALYQAIGMAARKVGGFLWIGNLAAPDIAVAVIASLLAALATKADTSAAGSSRLAIVSATVTFFLAWRLSAAVGLYWIASNAVGVGQALVLRREQPKQRE